MADTPESNGRNGRSWPLALGTILTCVIGSFTVIQVVMAPLDERVVALTQRVDEAQRGANVRLDEVIARSEGWRADYAASVRQSITEAAAVAEERRKRMAQRQDELNAGFGVSIGEVAARFNRMMEERERLLGEAFAIRRQMLDHIAMLDRRVQAMEEALERRPPLNCDQAGNCAAPFGPR